ncbi:MAG: hypothetical protein JO303_07385, partial [Caulobacteraceae bacterium]|nr:hypothetical protein [Caulobacteraceae bacterium]
IGGAVGAAISVTFLLIVGLINLNTLASVWAAVKRARRGGGVAAEDPEALLRGGLLTRLFRPVFGLVTGSWRMYPIGFLFGLGFDTATEVGLLGISAAHAVQGLPFWPLLVFPALFTVGMSLMDLADSAMMTGAYGWVFARPSHKLWYNLTLTAASVAIALLVAGVEAFGLVADKLGLQGGLWRSIGALNGNLGGLGFGLAAIFLAAWLLSRLAYRAVGAVRKN